MTARKKAPKPQRPKLQKISEQMRQWAALLATEVAQWPHVSLRSMFGMKAFYRGAAIFGVVPESFALDSPNTIMFKLLEPAARLNARLEADPRVSSHGKKWWLFELSTGEDLRDAIGWYSEAYEAAKAPAKKKSTQQKSKRKRSA
ncbi:MAG: hypothetical protein JWO13_946 [Acidobacteriales bacterium]|nr:hypothetical protein [Terriglobales bacterium]